LPEHGVEAGRVAAIEDPDVASVNRESRAWHHHRESESESGKCRDAERAAPRRHVRS
jgi:hypothetical protein